VNIHGVMFAMNISRDMSEQKQGNIWGTGLAGIVLDITKSNPRSYKRKLCLKHRNKIHNTT